MIETMIRDFVAATNGEILSGGVHANQLVSRIKFSEMRDACWFWEQVRYKTGIVSVTVQDAGGAEQHSLGWPVIITVTAQL